jgi:hypothetical protein
MKPRVVVPQGHAEGTASPSARLRLVTIVLALSAAAAVTSTLLLAPESSVRTWDLAILLGLAIAASQRVAIFGDETAINTSMVVLLASAGLAARGGPLWVPAVCGVVAGLHWDHVRNLAVRRLVVNASCTTLAVIASSLAGRVAYSSAGTVGLLVPIVGAGAVCIYWLVDNGLVALVLSAVDRSSPKRHLKELTRSETQILPFAFSGFLLAFVVPSRFGGFVFATSLLGLVLVADAVVVQARGRRSARLLLHTALLPAVLVGVVAVLVLAVVKDGIPTQAAFFLLLVAGLVGSLVLIRRPLTLTMCAPIVCATGAGVALGAGHAFFPSIAVAMSACLIPSSRLSTWSARLTLLCAAGVGSIAISCSLTLVPHQVVFSLWGALLAGAAAGLAGLFGWHSVVVLALMLRSDHADWRTALGNTASDLATFVLAGLVGGASGWTLVHSGLVASGTLLVVGLAIAIMTTQPTRLVAPQPSLADDQLLDVLQSALLDLPASRLPEE